MTKLNSQKITDFFFWLLFAASIMMFWVPKYFITGDGPCHMQNAIALKDIWNHGKDSFYSQYYVLNKNLSPNLFTHLFMGLLLCFFKPIIVEKIVLSTCMAAMALGFRFLMTSEKEKHNGLILLIFPLIFQAVFYKGFYNYIIGIGLFLFLSGVFYRYVINDHKKWTVPLLLLCGLLLYFIHIIAFLLFVVATGFMVLAKIFQHYKSSMNKRQSFQLLLNYIIITLPGLALIFKFSASNGNGNSIFVINNWSEYAKFLRNLRALYVVSDIEQQLASVLAILLMILGGYSIVLWCRRKGTKILSISYFLLFIFSLLVYFLLNDNLLGGSIIRLRFEVLVYLFIILFCSTIEPGTKTKTVVIFCSFIIALLFNISKWSPLFKTNKLLSKLDEAAQKMNDNGLVLSLSFCHNGIENGKRITENEWNLGCHAGQILGMERKLVFVDNYEASTNYFPLEWVPNGNPSYYLSTGNGIESERPMANIASYNDTVGKLTYIVLFNLQQKDTLLDEYKLLRAQIDTAYTQLYQSSDFRVQLYKINKM